MQAWHNMTDFVNTWSTVLKLYLNLEWHELARSSSLSFLFCHLPSIRDKPRNANHDHRNTKAGPFPIAICNIRNDTSNSRTRTNANQSPAKAEETGSQNQRSISAMLSWFLEIAISTKRFAGFTLCIKESWATHHDTTTHHKCQARIPKSAKIKEVQHLCLRGHSSNSKSNASNTTLLDSINICCFDLLIQMTEQIWIWLIEWESGIWSSKSKKLSEYLGIMLEFAWFSVVCRMV